MTEAELYRTVVKAVKYAYPQHRWMRLKNAAEYLDVTVNTVQAIAKRAGIHPHSDEGVVLWDMNEFDAYFEKLEVKE